MVLGRISYVDSFQSENMEDVALLRYFLEWSYARGAMQIVTGEWELDLHPTGQMTRQQPYLAPGQHPGLQAHIDCALYLYFLTCQLIAGG